MPNRIPIDPSLPEDFDDTPNGSRTKEELDQWWDHPYCVTNRYRDGRYSIRCLNGGAWDRSSELGSASTYMEACELAERRQAAWIKRREAPVISFIGDIGGPVQLVRLAQRPDHDIEVLSEYANMEELHKAHLAANGNDDE